MCCRKHLSETFPPVQECQEYQPTRENSAAPEQHKSASLKAQKISQTSTTSFERRRRSGMVSHLQIPEYPYPDEKQIKVSAFSKKYPYQIDYQSHSICLSKG